jgi:hypothetical protein
LTVTLSPDAVAVTPVPVKLMLRTPEVMVEPSSWMATVELVDIVTRIFSARSAATTSPTFISRPVESVMIRLPSKSILAPVTDTPSCPSLPS